MTRNAAQDPRLPMTVRLPKSLLSEIGARRQKEHLTLTQFVERAIHEYLQSPLRAYRCRRCEFSAPKSSDECPIHPGKLVSVV